MKIAVIVLIAIAIVVAGFFVATGPEPHIVIPGEVVTSVGPLDITSTLIGAWFAMVVLIVIAFFATRSMQIIPSGLQNLVEGLIEFLFGQVEEIAGRENARRFFPVIATFFLFILVGNWLALMPFYKTIGVTNDYGHEIFHEIQHTHEEGHTFEDKHHFLAWQMEDQSGIGVAPIGASTFKFDLHEGEEPSEALDHYIVALAEFYTDFEPHESDGHGLTAEDVAGALAALDADPQAPKFIRAGTPGVDGHAVPSALLGESFVALDFPGDKVALVYPFLRAAFSDLSNTLGLAIVAFLMIEFWGFRALGFGYLGKFFVNPLKSPIMTFVGFLELLSEFIRIISFSFRLFGNIFAGGVLILIMTFLVPFVAPLGIFALELFVGLIQAIVFSLLVLVFAVGAVEAHGEDHEEGHHGDGEGHPEDAHHTTGAAQAAEA